MSKMQSLGSGKLVTPVSAQSGPAWESSLIESIQPESIQYREYSLYCGPSDGNSLLLYENLANSM